MYSFKNIVNKTQRNKLDEITVTSSEITVTSREELGKGKAKCPNLKAPQIEK